MGHEGLVMKKQDWRCYGILHYGQWRVVRSGQITDIAEAYSLMDSSVQYISINHLQYSQHISNPSATEVTMVK
jgi:hypothetical protein